jgi:hypothetical protein
MSTTAMLEAIRLDFQLKLPKNEHSSLKFQDIAGTPKISLKEELVAELKDLTNDQCQKIGKHIN